VPTTRSDGEPGPSVASVGPAAQASTATRLAVDAAACDAAGAAALVRRLAAALEALLRDPVPPVAEHEAARR